MSSSISPLIRVGGFVCSLLGGSFAYLFRQKGCVLRLDRPQVADRCSAVIDEVFVASEATQPQEEEVTACAVRLRGSPGARPFEEGDASLLRFGGMGERRIVDDWLVARKERDARGWWSEPKVV